MKWWKIVSCYIAFVGFLIVLGAVGYEEFLIETGQYYYPVKGIIVKEIIGLLLMLQAAFITNIND